MTYESDDRAENTGEELDHFFVVAATVAVSDRLALRAHRTGRFEVPERTRIDALETYCARCRQPYERAEGTPCQPTEWLRGGPIGTRKRRKGGQMVRDGSPDPDPRLTAGR